MSDTLERLAAILVEHQGVVREHVIPTATIESLGIDSLGRVELQMDAEDGFGTPIDDDAYFEVVTVGDFVNLIDSHRKRA